MSLITSIYDLHKVVAAVPKNLPEVKDIWNIPSKELIGIEVEAEHVLSVPGLNQSVWTITEDGSLRNAGKEFITKPIEAHYAVAALHNLLGNCNFCFSPRTSVHVHLNCQDLTTNQVLDILLLYCLYEKTLYRFVGRGRWKNIYCTPITECGLLGQIAAYGVKAPWEKYTGLNLLPLSQHGTIEFRHMHGTTDVKKLSVWIDLITRLKEYVKTHETGSIRKLVNAFDEQQVLATASAIWGDIAGVLEISDPEEVLSRVPTVKVALLKNTASQRAVQNSISQSSKYYQI